MASPMASMARAACRNIGRNPELAGGAAGAARKVHTEPARMCGYYDYEHRENMYEIWNMKNRGLKFGLLIWGGIVGVGIALPLYIVRFQMKKGQM